MKRALCIWIPNWPIQRVAAARPELKGRPVVLYETYRGGRRVTACSAQAEAMGIAIGMPLAEATALSAQYPVASTQPETEVGSRKSEVGNRNDAYHVDRTQNTSEFRIPQFRIPSRPSSLRPTCRPRGPRRAGRVVPAVQPDRRDRLSRSSFILHPSSFSRQPPLGHHGPRAPLQRRGPASQQDHRAVCRPARSGRARGHCRHGGRRLGGGPLRGNAECKLQIANCKLQIAGCGASPAAKQFIIHHSSFIISYRSPRQTLAALRPLPIEALRLPAQVVEMLHPLGIHRIGQLESLPRAELAARLGASIARRWDQATGQAAEPIPASPLPAELQAREALEYPTARRQAVQWILQQLIGQVAQKLLDCGRGAMRLQCRLECQSDGPRPVSPPGEGLGVRG